MLVMKHLQKVYRTHLIETHALRDFSISVGEGEFVAVTGPSGSGKTTFLNIAGLLEEFTGGEYWLDNVDVSGMGDDERSRLRNEKLGFIFQSFNLIPDLNLFDNVDVPLRYRGFGAAERKQRIEEALTRVGLASRQKHYPAELSGGQYAYVVRDGVAVKTPVRLGARSVDRVEILSGLKPGDRVVVSGAENFHAAPTVGLSR